MGSFIKCFSTLIEHAVLTLAKAVVKKLELNLFHVLSKSLQRFLDAVSIKHFEALESGIACKRQEKAKECSRLPGNQARTPH